MCEVLTLVTKRIAVFWDMTGYSLVCTQQRFEESFFLYRQDRRISRAWRNQHAYRERVDRGRGDLKE
jgi:hypothetical protein